MAQEDTEKRDDEQSQAESGSGANPPEPPEDGDEIDDGCGGNP